MDKGYSMTGPEGKWTHCGTFTDEDNSEENEFVWINPVVAMLNSRNNSI